MGLSRRRTLKKSAAAVSLAAVLSSATTRTSLAASTVSGSGPTIESTDGTVDSLTIARNNVSLDLSWSGIENADTVVDVTVEAKLDGTTTYEEIAAATIDLEGASSGSGTVGSDVPWGFTTTVGG